MLSRASELQHINIQIVINTVTTRYTFTIIPTANSVQTHDHKFLFTWFRPQGGALVHLVNHLRRPKTWGMVLSKTMWLRMPYSVDQMRASLQMVEGFVKNPSVNFVRKKQKQERQAQPAQGMYTPKQCKDGAQWRHRWHPATLARTPGPEVPAKDYRHVLPTQLLYYDAKKHKG